MNNWIEKQKARLPTEFGAFDLIVYKADCGTEHAAIVKGPVSDPALVRVHSKCFTGDVLHSERCDCKNQLHAALKLVSERTGVVVYLDQEGRGIGLLNKIKAYNLQDRGLDTVEANEHLGFEPDERDYEIACAILKDLGISNVNLMTNNPEKINALKAGGITVVDRVPIVTASNENNKTYLETKKEKMGHLMSD